MADDLKRELFKAVFDVGTLALEEIPENWNMIAEKIRSGLPPGTASPTGQVSQSVPDLVCKAEGGG